MRWIVFTYSLPSQANAVRVALWRRLQRLGAVSPTTGVFILPATDECQESFLWLSQEVRQGGGEGLIFHVDQFQGLDSGGLVQLFNEGREEEYRGLAGQLGLLISGLEAGNGDSAWLESQASLSRLRKEFADVNRRDYFHSQAGVEIAAMLSQAEARLSPPAWGPEMIAPKALADFRDAKWATRPRPHVDRLACAWLIRRYINPEASIRYTADPAADEVTFDMGEADFGHVGNRCTFEGMVQAFGIEEEGLQALAEIVHEIDLWDGRYLRPEASGVDAVLRGWLLEGLPDEDIESRGLALFDGLSASLARAGSDNKHKESRP